MKRIILFLLVIHASLIFGNQFEVISELEVKPRHMGLFSHELSDLKKYDNRGELGALVIVNCGLKDVFFDNIDSKISLTPKIGTYWVVMKPESQYFVLKKEGFADYRYNFPSPLEGATVYEMTIDEKLDLTTVVITTNQDLASVYVNGQLFGETVDRIFTANVARGVNEIEVRKVGFKTKSVIHNVRPENNRIEINLEPALPAVLSITSNPEGALVLIDDLPIGTTPINTYYNEGDYSITIEKDDFETIKNQITITQPETIKNYILKDLRSSLTVRTNPGASVIINGALYIGGVEDLKLLPQLVDITIEQDYCEEIHEEYQLKENEVKIYRLYPRDKSATLTVNTSEKSDLKLNNVAYTEIKDLKMLASVVLIEVTYPNDERIMQIVNLEARENKTVDILLEDDTNQLSFYNTQIASYGTINISSNPTGATATIDGREIGKTPLNNIRLESGNHNLVLALVDYKTTSNDFVVTNGDEVTFNEELIFNLSDVTIRCPSTENVVLYLNGKSFGQLPYHNPKFLAGSYNLELRKELWTNTKELLVINPNETIIKDVVLTPNYGTLKITAKDADIYIENEKVGHDKVEIKKTPGFYLITAKRENYTDDSVDIYLLFEQEENISLEPQPRLGDLSILTVDKRKTKRKIKNANIYLDNKLSESKTPATLTLFRGDYDLKITHPKFLDFQEKITVSENETKEITIPLEFYKGTRQYYYDRHSRRAWISAGLASLLIGGAITCNIVANTYYDEYGYATDNVIALDYKDKTEQWRDYRDYAYYSASGVGLYTFYSWIRTLFYN